MCADNTFKISLYISKRRVYINLTRVCKILSSYIKIISSYIEEIKIKILKALMIENQNEKVKRMTASCSNNIILRK